MNLFPWPKSSLSLLSRHRILRPTCISWPATTTLHGPSMANYLPVLLGSVNAIPDDSALSDLPRGQVDYLSHEWREEDVWRSWRNMTRLKNEIANGVRLENASWRTWWKQRNGLKTVTPETLNWYASSSGLLPPLSHLPVYRLKDSDVTWLYGPLHTAEQPVYTPKPSPTTAAALDLPSSPSPALFKKPILKHRSISERLTSDFPLSPLFSPPDSEDDDSLTQNTAQAPSRPSLMRTKSDTHITRWGPSRVFRRDSPPRIIPAGAPSATEMHLTLLQPHNATEPVSHKRKHISFNTFVEQCIAIDQPQSTVSRPGTLDDTLDEDDGSVSPFSFLARALISFLAMTKTRKMASSTNQRSCSSQVTRSTCHLLHVHHASVFHPIPTHRTILPLPPLLQQRMTTMTTSWRCVYGMCPPLLTSPSPVPPHSPLPPLPIRVLPPVLPMVHVAQAHTSWLPRVSTRSSSPSPSLPPPSSRPRATKMSMIHCPTSRYDPIHTLRLVHPRAGIGSPTAHRTPL